MENKKEQLIRILTTLNNGYDLEGILTTLNNGYDLRYDKLKINTLYKHLDFELLLDRKIITMYKKYTKENFDESFYNKMIYLYNFVNDKIQTIKNNKSY